MKTPEYPPKDTDFTLNVRFTKTTSNTFQIESDFFFLHIFAFTGDDLYWNRGAATFPRRASIENVWFPLR